jgi:hypothetical protein
MGKLSELYAERLKARRVELEAKTRDIAAVLARIQHEVLGTRYPPASRPFKPPHLRSGRLQRESTVKPNPSSGTITFVAPTPYAVYLKQGTARMKPRPWQDEVLKRAQPEIDRIEKRNMPFGSSR